MSQNSIQTLWLYIQVGYYIMVPKFTVFRLKILKAPLMHRCPEYIWESDPVLPTSNTIFSLHRTLSSVPLQISKTFVFFLLQVKGAAQAMGLFISVPDI